MTKSLGRQLRAGPLILCILLVATVVLGDTIVHSSASAGVRDGEFMFGIDGTMTMTLRRAGLKWYNADGGEADPLVALGRAGVTWFRLGITTNSTGTISLEEALELARWARNTAYRLDLFFYLSPALADLGKQPAQPEWEGMTIEDRAEAIRGYMRDTVGRFMREGLSDHVYEIGNEIDYGIAGAFDAAYLVQGDSPSVYERLVADVWTRAASLLRGAILGVKEADPEAKIVLHIAHWWNAGFAKAFFDFMSRNGVQFDMMALSFYPSSGVVSLAETIRNPNQGDATRSQELLVITVNELSRAIGKPVIIAEYAYPSSPEIHGLFSWWNKQVSDYPLTPDGQAGWIDNHLSWAYNTDAIRGLFYFQPQFHGPQQVDLWQSFALFDSSGHPKPALGAMRNFASTTPELSVRMAARTLILDAWEAINKAEQERRTEGLTEAKTKLQEANGLFFASKYDMVGPVALEAKRLAEAAPTAEQTLGRIVFVGVLLSAIVGVSILVGRRLRRRRRLEV